MKTTNNKLSGLNRTLSSILFLFWAMVSVAQVNNNPQNATVQALNPGPDRGICPGGQTILDAGTGFASYLWTDGIITATTRTINVTNPGSYQVTVTDGLGNSQMDTVNVTYNNSPVADFAFLGPVNGGPDQGFLNNSNNAMVYYWEFGDGYTSFDANPVHNFANQSSYTVCLMASNECGMDSYCQNVNASWKTSPKQFVASEMSGIKVYPSPTQGPFTVDLGLSTEQVLSIKVTTVNGTIVAMHNGPFTGTQHNFDLGQKLNGLYNVVITTKTGQVTRRVIKL